MGSSASGSCFNAASDRPCGPTAASSDERRLAEGFIGNFELNLRIQRKRALVPVTVGYSGVEEGESQLLGVR